MFSATERNSTRANLWKHLFPFAWCLLGGLLVLLAGTLPVSAHAVARYTLASIFDGIMQEGETIHVLAGKTCYVLTPEGRLEPCPYDCAKKPAEAWANIPSFLMITPEKHTYGLTINGELFLWTPGAETPWKYITTYEDIGSKHNGENPEYHELDIAYHADESTIYEQVFDRKTVSMEINCYDIATGEWKHLYTTENYDYSPGAIHPDGGLVTVGHSYGKTLLLRYTKNGKCETIVETEPFSQHIYGLVSDDSDGWYIITDNSLYHLSADGETTLVNTFTRMLFEWYAPTYYLPANQSVGFRSGNLFMLYTSPLYMEERQTLNIDGKTSLMGLSFDLTAYENRHLTTSVMLKDRLSDFTDMAQAVSLGDLDNDLYVVSTYDNGIQSLKKKGVFYDLSGNQEIAAYVDSLYPTWRNLVTTEDGRIAGVPMLVNGHYQLNYRESIWEENRLGEVPKTYDELLDCIEAWHEDGRLESVRLLESGDTFRQLALQMLKNNAARYAARGEAAVYSNETLLQLLKRLEGLRDMLADYDRMNVLGEALFQTDRWYQMMYSPDYADYIDLPLGMEDENDYGCLMDLYVMVVNPRSKQPELAIQFIQETLGDRYQTSERMLVMPGEELGVINEEALAHIKQATAELQVYQEQYAQLREQGYSPDWMLPNMNALQGSLDYYADERTHYTILPEYDAIFRDAMEHVAVNAADGYLLMWDNAGNAINDFIDGKNSPESMLKKMDEVVWMWTMENQ